MSGATPSEAKLVMRRRREERLKARKRKRLSRNQLLANAAGDQPPERSPDRGSDDGEESSDSDDTQSEDELTPNCTCGIPEPPTL
eukprot:11224808-Alexandrium_andersonii.AAC.1